MARSADPEAEMEARTWIEGVIGHPLEGDSLQEALKSGQALCQLINVFAPGSTKASKRTLPIVQRENITQYLKACRKFGVDEYEMFGTNDLYDGKDMRAVVTQMHALGRKVQELKPDYEGPTLGHKVVKKRTIAFSKKQLAAARATPSALNAGASGLAGIIPGSVTAVTSDNTGKTSKKAAGSKPVASKPVAAAAAEVEAEAEVEAAAAAAEVEEVEAAATEAEDEAAAAAEVAEQAEDEDASDDATALPAGWQELQTEDGRTYFYHEDSEVTQWDRPAGDGEAAAAETADDALPEGWEAKETDDGKVYYYNEATETTQWEKPTADESETEAVSGAGDAEVLPEGWEAKETDDGKVYYYNEATETTQWEKPTADGSEAAGDDEAALPAGWQELQTEDGRTYFYNESTETTQWDRPTA